MVLKDKDQVAKNGNYLAKRLTTMVILEDLSMHVVAILYDKFYTVRGVSTEGPSGPSSLISPVGLPIESRSVSYCSWIGMSTCTLPQ